MHAFLSCVKVHRSVPSSLTMSSMLPVDLTIQAHVHGSKVTVSRFFSFITILDLYCPILAFKTKCTIISPVGARPCGFSVSSG